MSATIRAAPTGSRRRPRAGPLVAQRIAPVVIAGVHRYEIDPPAAYAAIARYTDVQDHDVLEDTYGYYKGRFQRDLYPSLDAIAAELESRVAEVPAAASARPDEFVDLELVGRLRQIGFADSLYR
jgi:hypothetical protein